MDKIQKIREEVERLKSQLLRGACSSQIAMETLCKEEAYNEVLAILDTMQKEPSKFDAAIQEGDDVRYNEDLGCRVNLSQLKRVAKKEEPVSEDLEEAIDTYLKSYWGGEKEKQELPFLKKMVIHFAKWQKEQMMAKGVDGEVTYGKSLAIPSLGWVLEKEGLNFGDKVKLIIIKEN